ncbi:cytochrome c [Ectothiorhodospiraceae bacterium WFHF3C12]|nr:cytochrome c [Ectothiorhodospiraceae bacterium WFHF3C12]
MSRTIIAVTALVLAVTVALPALGESQSSSADPVTPKLTDKLRGLLQAEMQQIDQAMRDIYTAIISGDHETVADRARAVHESFILKQSLTPADRKDLVQAVPKDFLARDKAFHATALKLAEAGERRETRAELRHFERMTRQCTGCHARYVSDRFPGVGQPAN